MKQLLTFSFLLIGIIVNSQNTFEKRNEVFKKMHSIDSVKMPIIDSININFDEINMKVKRSVNIIEAEGYIGQSKNLLKIKYFISNNILQAIETKEISPYMSDLFMIWIFNLEHDEIVNEFSSHTVRSCLPTSSDYNIYKAYGYNEKWNSDFLKINLTKLYNKVKNYR